jgi:hypothetical protein
MKRSPNPTLNLARQVAAARLKRAGFTKLTSLKRRDAPPIEHRFSDTLIQKLAGG